MFKLLSILALASSFALAAPVDQQQQVQRRGSGSATYYSQNGNAGSCGSTHSDSDYIVALGSSNNPSSNCGKSVKITSDSGSVTATVADTCESCGSNHIDLSKGAFQALGDMSAGEISVNWYIE